MGACELSASGSAFGTFLSAFIGSILNGLFNGFYIAFLTGWIAWLSVTRILAAGIYEGYLVATKPLDQDDYTSIHMQPLVPNASAPDDTERQQPTTRSHRRRHTNPKSHKPATTPRAPYSRACSRRTA
ncbi:hypothetical protein MAPG_08978 [Magnaporthiopsis poae ATCC 64411]|uniref:Uncharacterized protein n=1 Tax=Magnaporthiopsis poae (strain ATCC 64411 / 73-15) TaxID=644358 RepID=A0A0C4E8R2_MAGP6|nr:hypothetical protein MAPG_08978 [Magnaporthiopsis poae ATCC 64411]